MKPIFKQVSYTCYMTIKHFTRSEEIAQVRTWRRDLHQIPELGLDLPKTCAYIENALSDLSCKITHPLPCAVAAFFDAGKESTIAFRSDMDALPVNEQTGQPYQSRYPGRMHACGHDGHMSNLLLFAHRLERYYRDLDQNVLLIFQPGEENPGGAKPIVESGLLETYHVNRIFGMHLWPLLEKGAIASRPGPLMARSCEVTISIHGKAAHVARFQEGADAIEACMDVLNQAYALVASMPEDSFCLLRFGKMEGGRIRNVVAEECVLEGTLRAFEEADYHFLRNSIEDLCHKIGQKRGVQIELSFSSGYPAVINDRTLFQTIEKEIPSLQILEKPELITEDFSGYLQQLPGVFFFLGTGTGIELHDSHFDFEEDLLLAGADLFEALSRLHFPDRDSAL